LMPVRVNDGLFWVNFIFVDGLKQDFCQHNSNKIIDAEKMPMINNAD